jgi:hypothetical protein
VPDDGKWAIGVTEFKDEDIVDAEVVGEEPAAGARAEVVGEPAVRFGQVDTGGVEPVKDKVVDPSVERDRHLGTHAGAVIRGIKEMPEDEKPGDGFVAGALDDTDRQMSGGRRPVEPESVGGEVNVTVTVDDSYTTLKRGLRPWLTDELLDKFREIGNRHGRTDEDLHRMLKQFDGEFLKRLGLPLTDEMIDKIDVDNPGDLSLLIDAKLAEKMNEVGPGDFDLWLRGLWPAMAERDRFIDEERRRNPYGNLPPPPSGGKKQFKKRNIENPSLMEAMFRKEPKFIRKLKDRFPFLDDKEGDKNVRLSSLRRSLGVAACVSSGVVGAVYTLPKVGAPGVILTGVGATMGKVVRERSKRKRRGGERVLSDVGVEAALAATRDERIAKAKEQLEALRGGSVLTAVGGSAETGGDRPGDADVLRRAPVLITAEEAAAEYKAAAGAATAGNSGRPRRRRRG